MRSATRWRTAVFAAAIICASAAGVAGCDTTIAGQPRAGGDRGPLSWGPDLTEPQLAGVLLDASQINQIMGATAMIVVKRYDKLTGDNGGSYSDPGCAAAVFNTVEAGYKGSGYLATRGSELHEPEANYKHYVDQGVVSFGSGSDARRYLATAQDTWRRCVDKHVTYTPQDGKPSTWTIRQPVTTAGVTAAFTDLEGGDGYSCTHAITAKVNVVIDISACSYDSPDRSIAAANTVVNAIAAKFPA
jgi:PknH-like extracellular domain